MDSNKQVDQSIPLTIQQRRETNENSDSQTGSVNDTAPPPADFLFHAIRLSTSATLGAGLTVMAEVGLSPITTETELWTSLAIMGAVVILSGSIVARDTINNYYREGAPEVSLFHHGIRLVAAVLLGGSVAHLSLSGTPFAAGGHELLALMATMAITSSLFLAADTRNSYYPDATVGCCKRTQFIKNSNENLRVSDIYADNDN